VTKLEWSK